MAAPSHPVLQKSLNEAMVFPTPPSYQNNSIDPSDNAFAIEARRQARLAATSAQAAEDLTFVEALSANTEISAD